MSESTQDNSPYPASSDTTLVPVTLELTTTDERSRDGRLVELWLHGRSLQTQRAYRADARRFQTFAGKSLAAVTLGDLQAFSDALEATGTQPATRHRTIAAVKSLFAFGHRLGYLPFDTARPLRLPKLRDELANRILDESDVQRMLALEANPRNSAILFLLYAAGLRVSELCGLRWRDLASRQLGLDQITVLGKGSKTRTILIPSGVKAKLDRLRGDGGHDAFVFRSRRKGSLSTSQVLRIVKAAAKQAGIPQNVVCHTFRHAHASHSLERGAPVHLVQQTLGHSDLSTTGRYLHARPDASSSQYLGI